MTYDPNIPQPSEDPSTSQGEILSNFQVLGADFQVNHVPLGAITNAGKHNFVELVNQAGVPSATTSEGTIYSKAVTRNGITTSETFYTPDNTGDEYQLTQIITAQKATFSTNPGFTFLPGGLILMWGTIAPSSNVTNAVNFAGLGLPNFTSIYQASFTTMRNGNSSPGSTFVIFIDNSSLGNTGFNIINRSTHTYGFYWTALGK